jgi:hypothetical protein
LKLPTARARRECGYLNRIPFGAMAPGFGTTNGFGAAAGGLAV